MQIYDREDGGCYEDYNLSLEEWLSQYKSVEQRKVAVIKRIMEMEEVCSNLVLEGFDKPVTELLSQLEDGVKQREFLREQIALVQKECQGLDDEMETVKQEVAEKLDEIENFSVQLVQREKSLKDREQRLESRWEKVSLQTVEIMAQEAELKERKRELQAKLRAAQKDQGKATRLVAARKIEV